MTTTPPAHQKGGLTLFFAVTFAATWACWLVTIVLGEPAMSFPAIVPYLLGAFGPTIGAVVIRVRRARRKEPVPAHAVPTRLNARLAWAPLLLVVASATVLAAALLVQVSDGVVVDLTAAGAMIQAMGGPVAFLALMLLGGPLPEEPGWRGTAYPRLLASMGRVQAALLLGVIWALWHLPLFFVNGTIQAAYGLASPNGVLYLISIIPMALLIGYAYERGGVVTAIAVHLGVNGTVALLGVNSPKTQALIIGIQAIVALALIAGRRSARDPEAGARPEPEQARTDASHPAR